MKDLKQWEKILLNFTICPDCKQEGFLEGPHGGDAVNIQCANPECGSRFNVVPGVIGFSQRISEPQPLAHPVEGAARV